MATGSSNYFTPTRLHLARLQSAIARLSEMVQDLVKISLEETFDDSWDDESGHLWNRWISDNYAFVKKYRFFQSQTKETTAAGLEVPVFSDCDVTFLGYLLQQIKATFAA